MKQKSYESLYIDTMRHFNRLNKVMQKIHHYQYHAVSNRATPIDSEEINNTFINHAINNKYY